MTALFRAALLAALTAACVPSVAVAQNVLVDSLLHQIDSLERRTIDLERRVSDLEALIGAQPSKSKPVPKSAGSQDLANWRRLNEGMTTDQVRKLLGEPTSVGARAGFIFWTYPENASVTFWSGKVNGWSEPSR